MHFPGMMDRVRATPMLLQGTPKTKAMSIHPKAEVKAEAEVEAEDYVISTTLGMDAEEETIVLLSIVKVAIKHNFLAEAMESQT